MLELNCEGLILRTLESSEFCQFESLKIAKNSAKISEFFNKYQKNWPTKIFANIYQWKFGLVVNTLVYGVHSPQFDAWLLPIFFFLLFKNFNLLPLIWFDWKFSIHFDASLVFRVNYRRISNNYSKYSLLVPRSTKCPIS